MHADGTSDAEVLVQRGTLDRESLRLGVVQLKTPEQRLAWLADHLAEQPGSGIVYCLTVAATQEVAGYLRERGLEVAAYSGQTEPDERHASRAGPRRGPGQGADRDQRPGHGLRRQPRLRDQPRCAAVAGGLLPAGRPRRPRHRRGDGRAAAPDRGPRHLGLLRLPRLPPRGAGARDAGRPRRVRPPAVHRDPGDPRRARPQPARVDAQGPRRRRRRPAGAGRLGRDRPAVGLRRRALRPRRGGPRARAAGDARLPHDRPSAGCATSASSSTTPTPPTAAGATTAAA